MPKWFDPSETSFHWDFLLFHASLQQGLCVECSSFFGGITMWAIIISRDDGYSDSVITEVCGPFDSRMLAVDQARRRGWWQGEGNTPNSWTVVSGFGLTIWAEIHEMVSLI